MERAPLPSYQSPATRIHTRSIHDQFDARENAAGAAAESFSCRGDLLAPRRLTDSRARRPDDIAVPGPTQTTATR